VLPSCKYWNIGIFIVPVSIFGLHFCLRQIREASAPLMNIFIRTYVSEIGTGAWFEHYSHKKRWRCYSHRIKCGCGVTHTASNAVAVLLTPHQMRLRCYSHRVICGWGVLPPHYLCVEHRQYTKICDGIRHTQKCTLSLSRAEFRHIPEGKEFRLECFKRDY